MTSLDKLEQKADLSVSLAIAVVSFSLSSLYFTSNRDPMLSITKFPQFAIYVILGFYHAYNVWELENVIAGRQTGMVSLFASFLVYTAWYIVVLLPESGIGYMEWLIVFLVLTSNFITEISSKKIHNPFMGQRPMVLVFFGTVLFFCKQIIFYLFEDNLYDQFFFA